MIFVRRGERAGTEREIEGEEGRNEYGERESIELITDDDDDARVWNWIRFCTG